MAIGSGPPEQPEPSEPLERLGSDEVRSRAAGGAAVLGARGALVFAFGLVANIALARMLSPRDFGVVALGSVLVLVGTYLSDGGMGAALIRRERPPERSELAAVAGLQLAVATFVAALGAGAALLFGHDGLVIAVMLASLPVSTGRLPAAIVLERRLLYRPIAFVDLVEALSYYVWALVAVALGFGVWGLATAVLARAVIGVLTMARAGPVGLVLPRWSWSRVRPIIGFGAKLQATTVVAVARDQGLNVGVAAVAGVSTLGVWSLAYRILQVPTLIINSAVRVSFPTMSRMLEAREDPRGLIERGIGTTTVALAAVLVAIVGCAPAALPALLGESWADVPPTLLWSALGLVLSAPVVVATIGYLYAADRGGTVAWGAAAQAVVWLAVALPLLPALGSVAVGLGSIPAGIVIAAVVGRRAAGLTGARILRSALVPAALAVLAGAAGWLVSASGPETVLVGAAGAATAEIVLVAALWVARRDLLAGTYALAARATKSVSARPA